MDSPDYYTKEILVLGCGNILYGDDGFGPVVADYLISNYKIPENAAVLNLGLSTRGFIFDILLSEEKPKRIIIVDAVSHNGRKPGEIFEVPLDNLVKEKVDDFSFHQGPTSNLLKELRDICGVSIVIISAQPEEIPKEMKQGLSEPLKKAAPRAAVMIYDKYLKPKTDKEKSKYVHPICSCAKC
ncbi:MAG: hydrogenase maturation protease [Planctomycetota bacterium]|nr:hydrogenase maturation protease [Planctomycetota bacterium]MDI6787235.1 hydrogenase maturation protease [Planctomycetota bacterium]